MSRQFLVISDITNIMIIPSMLNEVFTSSAVEYVEISNGITSIGQKAFSECKTLRCQNIDIAVDALTSLPTLLSSRSLVPKLRSSYR